MKMRLKATLPFLTLEARLRSPLYACTKALPRLQHPLLYPCCAHASWDALIMHSGRCIVHGALVAAEGGESGGLRRQLKRQCEGWWRRGRSTPAAFGSCNADRTRRSVVSTHHVKCLCMGAASAPENPIFRPLLILPQMFRPCTFTPPAPWHHAGML